MRLRLPAEARRRFDAWQGSVDGDTVEEAGRAEYAAELFARAGEFALARRYAEESAAHRTGAALEFRAAALSAAIDRDWKQAQDAYRRSYERYGDDGDLARAAWMSSIGGDLRSARDDLAVVGPRQSNALPGRVAVHVARRAGVDAAELRKIILAWPGAGEERSGHVTWTRTWMAVEALLVDREPSAADIDFLRSVARDTGQVFVSLARGWAALRADRPQDAAPLLLPLYPVLDKPSSGLEERRPEAFPLLVEALIRTDRLEDAVSVVDGRRRDREADAWYYLARALIEEAGGRHGQAVDALWQAFVLRDEGTTLVLTLPQVLLDVTERMHRRTGDPRYRTLLDDVASRLVPAEPSGWAYAFLAAYSSDPARRREAAAAALALDARSATLNRRDAGTLAEARRRVAERDPFAHGE